MVKDKRKQRIPNEHKDEPSIDLVRRIIRQAGISKDEWDKA